MSSIFVSVEREKVGFKIIITPRFPLILPIVGSTVIVGSEYHLAGASESLSKSARELNNINSF
jgi:hypothetical protein